MSVHLRRNLQRNYQSLYELPFLALAYQAAESGNPQTDGPLHCVVRFRCDREENGEIQRNISHFHVLPKEIAMESIEVLGFYSKIFTEVHVSPHRKLIQGLHSDAGQM